MAKKVAVLAVNPVNGFGLFQYLEAFFENGISYKVYAEVPPRVEYCLTERGLSLIPHLEGLVNWALQQMPGIMESREKNDSVQKPM